MRAFRLFPDVTAVPVEWRIAGFRVRNTLAISTLLGLLVAGGVLAINIWLGAALAACVAVLSGMTTVYIYRNDPDLVLSETTMASLLWKASRRRVITNETKRK